MDKYDEAIAFLKKVEPGSYFDECAALMEELVAKEPDGKRFSAPWPDFKPIDASIDRQNGHGALQAWRWRMSQRSSAMEKGA